MLVQSSTLKHNSILHLISKLCLRLITKRMWHIDQPNASLRAGNLQCDINLESPQVGLQNTTAYQQRLSHNQFVQMKMGLEKEFVAEAYHRGDDLITLYSSHSQRQATPQLYWRMLEHREATGIETIISLQTDLLDSRCPIRTSTKLVNTLAARALTEEGQWEPAHSVLNAKAILVQLSSSISYLEIVHPTDLMNTLVQDYSETSITWEHTVLDLQLEKGVIRRARLQSWWLHNDSGLELTKELIDRFSQSTPPLTT